MIGTAENGGNIVFVIEGTAGMGAYFKDLKANYLHPALL